MLTPTDRLALKQQLIAHEGRRRFPYDDGRGNLTIGIGHNLTANGLPDPIVDALYDDDEQDVEQGIAAALPWALALSPVRIRVLIDIGFNAGVHGLLNFPKMLAALQAGNYSGAAAEILNSHLAPGRRERLALMMRTG